MTIEEMKAADCLLFECTSGSRAYGTDTPESDTDVKGVFILPRQQFYGLDETEQVNDASHDTTYYEIGRFVELLLKSNPNVLEILYAPEDCVRERHAVFDRLKAEWFLSKQPANLCRICDGTDPESAGAEQENRQPDRKGTSVGDRLLCCPQRAGIGAACRLA